MYRAQTSHPLDPLTAVEITVALATVRAAGATPEVLITNFLIIVSLKKHYFEITQFPDYAR